MCPLHDGAHKGDDVVTTDVLVECQHLSRLQLPRHCLRVGLQCLYAAVARAIATEGSFGIKAVKQHKNGLLLLCLISPI